MLTDERTVTFSEAAKALPKINGKRPHPSTLWRWSRRGFRGVHLETRRFGGRIVTSIEALDRFGKALAEIPLQEAPAPAPKLPKSRTDARRRRDVARAEKTLREAKIL